MKRNFRAVWAIAVVIPVLMATAPAALAGSVASSSNPSGVTPFAQLQSYRQVFSEDTGDNPYTKTEANAQCPAGTKAVGGGAVFDNENIFENMQSSEPVDGGVFWQAIVTNVSNRADSFRAFAVCVAKVSNYKIVVGTSVDNPAGAQTGASVSCPSGTVLFGGGASSSGTRDVNLNVSAPNGAKWTVFMNNASTADASVRAVVVCGRKPAGYSVVAGADTEVEPYGQSEADVSCPTNHKVLGGGGYSASTSTSVDLNATEAVGSGSWQATQDDETSVGTDETAYAVCATVS